MQFSIGAKARVINNYRNRVTNAVVEAVTPEHVQVYNADKDEVQFFSITEPHIALGDYWETQEVRPELISLENAEGIRLNDERIHREHATRVRRAVESFAKEPTDDTLRELKIEVARWAGHTMPKVAA